MLEQQVLQEQQQEPQVLEQPEPAQQVLLVLLVLEQPEQVQPEPQDLQQVVLVGLFDRPYSLLRFIAYVLTIPYLKVVV